MRSQSYDRLRSFFCVGLVTCAITLAASAACDSHLYSAATERTAATKSAASLASSSANERPFQCLCILREAMAKAASRPFTGPTAVLGTSSGPWPASDSRVFDHNTSLSRYSSWD